MIPIRRALISVSDKTGLKELVAALAARGVELLSTGGTAKAIAAAGHPVTLVSDYTGAPEILDGRVKTLHPTIHGGLLGRDTPEHRAQMEANAIQPIDLVVVNLYPFEATVASAEVTIPEAIEKIDIGGPSMLRSAAKNHERVCVLVDPSDYSEFLEQFEASDGKTSAAMRFACARKVFARTAAYDAAIASHLSRVSPEVEGREDFPVTLGVQWEKRQDLRYGENPHQKAAFYAVGSNPLDAQDQAGEGEKAASLADAEVLQGKALSYNNILDLDAALACCLEHKEGCAVVVKHTNPCGVAVDAADIASAYQLARACDPLSAFGGIVAVNLEVNEGLASQLVETFLECVVAPSYSDAAMEILRAKKNLRLVRLPAMNASNQSAGAWNFRSVAGGLLVQEADESRCPAKDAKVVTKRAPSSQELAALDFGWRVVKHVKSNAILFCKDQQTLAVGAGQMSRVDSAKVAVMKAQSDLAGSTVASDAFFPFRDGIDALAEAGATSIIQPGGSMRDQEVIDAADEHGIAMLFTSMRHFRH